MTHNAAICEVARAGEWKDRSFNEITLTQFAVILLNDLSFPSSSDVIRPQPVRPTSY